MKKQRLLAALAAMALACSAAACGTGGSSGQTDALGETKPGSEAVQSGSESGTGNAGEDNGEIKTGGVLKIGTPAAIVNIGYPGKLTTPMELAEALPAVESLCRYTKEGELVPWLCEFYETDADALTLTVKLKEGIKFHDGSDFNAEAVKWNWEEFTAQGRSEILSIESIECPDEYTVVAHLSQWDNTIADNALYQAGFMFSPAYAKENGMEAAGNHPVGTGPYRFVEWEKDVRLVYEKNEDYWIEGQPYMDGIEFVFIKDANTITTAYQSGEIDVLTQGAGDILTIMDATGEASKAEIGLNGGATISMVAFGCTDESSPCKDIKVRQAFCHAVDWEAMCEACGGMYYTNQWAVPGAWSYNESVAGYSYDVEKAKELLAEAGYENGVEINCYTIEGNTTQAAILQQFVADAGITLNIETVDQARQDEMSGINGNWDGVILSAGRVDMEIASIYERSFTDGGVRYVGGFLHPEDLVEGIANAKAARTQEEKEQYSQEISKMVIDEYCMVAPFGISESKHWEKDYVHGLGMNKTHLVLWTPEACWLDK